MASDVIEGIIHLTQINFFWVAFSSAQQKREKNRKKFKPLLHLMHCVFKYSNWFLINFKFNLINHNKKNILIYENVSPTIASILQQQCDTC